MYQWRKFEEVCVFGYLQTELNATSEYFADAHKGACACTRARTNPHMKGVCILGAKMAISILHKRNVFRWQDHGLYFMNILPMF